MVVQCYRTQSIWKTGLNIHEILEKLDECEGKLSELLIDSATDESETNSPIRPAYQENSYEIVYLYRTRKGKMRSKMVIERINDIKFKLDSKVMGRIAGKVKVNPESPARTAILVKRKRVENVDDLGQGDDGSQGTSRGTDLSAVPPILLAGLKYASYKTKRG